MSSGEPIEIEKLLGLVRQLDGMKTQIATYNRPADVARVNAEIENLKGKIAANLDKIEFQQLPPLSDQAQPVNIDEPRAQLAAVRKQLEMGVDPKWVDPTQQEMRSQDWVHFGLYPNMDASDALFRPENESAFRDWALQSSINVDMIGDLDSINQNANAPPPQRGMAVWGNSPSPAEQSPPPVPNQNDQNPPPPPNEGEPPRYNHLESWLDESHDQ